MFANSEWKQTVAKKNINKCRADKIIRCKQSSNKFIHIWICNKSLDMLHKRLTGGSLTSWHDKYSSTGHRQSSGIS